MRKIFALLLAVLLLAPAVFAYHGYDSRSSDYALDRDFEYVKYSENERATRNYNSDCGYYDYGYYGRRCNRSRDSVVYERSRDFEFGSFHESIRSSSNYDSGYRNFNSYRYPDNRYSNYGSSYSYPYEGGRFSGGIYGGVYGGLPYRY